MHSSLGHAHLKIQSRVIKPCSHCLPSLSHLRCSAALHRAAFMGHLQVVELLLAAGATPGLPDADGQTALHKAVQRGHSHVAAALLAAAPDLAGVRDKRGRLAADLAASAAAATPG